MQLHSRKRRFTDGKSSEVDRMLEKKGGLDNRGGGDKGYGGKAL